MTSISKTSTGQRVLLLDISIENNPSTLGSVLRMHQIIDILTREDNILDVFFTNRPSLVNRSTVIHRISGDYAVYIDSNITMTRQKHVKRSIFMRGKPNTQRMKEMCKEPSNSIINEFASKSNINDGWSFF